MSNVLAVVAIAGLLGGAGYFAWIALAPEPPSLLSAEASTVALGQSLYAENCAACHGDSAKGELPSAPKGGQRADGRYVAPALDGSGHAWHHPPAALFQVVKHGSPAQDSPMRGWADRLEDEEIHAVLAYLHSLWPEQVRSRYAQSFGTGRQGS